MAGKTDIGSLAVKVTAEASEFNRAVDAAGVKLSTLAQKGGQGFNVQSLTDGIKGALANPVDAIGGLVGKAIPFALPAAAFAGVAANSFAVGHSFHETTKRAEELGISTGALTGLTIAAKDRADEMQVALQHLERMIGEAAGGSKEAQAKFEALGVSWKDLQSMTPEAAFGKLNDRIRESGDAYTKAANARAFYGRQGQQNMRLIEGGSAAIEAGMATAQAKGLVPDAEFTKHYQEYLAAKRDVSQTLEGFKNKIAVTFGTPLLAATTGTFKAASAMFEGYDYTGQDEKRQQAAAAAQKAHDAAQVAATAEAQARERSLEAASKELIATRTTTEELDKQLAHRGAAGLELKMREAQREEQKARGEGGSSLDLLREMTGGGAGQNEAADKWHKVATAIGEVLDKQNELKRSAELGSQTKSLLAEIESPLEKFQAKQTEITTLWNTGRLSIEQYGRAMAKLTEDMEKAAETAKAGPMPGLQMGSQADRSFGLQMARDQKAAEGKGSLEERRQAATDKLITAQNNNTQALKDFVSNLGTMQWAQDREDGF